MLEFVTPLWNSANVPLKDAEKMFSKFVPFINDKVVKKDPFVLSDLKSKGYLYSAEPTDPPQNVPAGLEEQTAYGLHSYGGYYMFFRPDFWEVLTLFTMLDVSKRIDDMEAVYCTTVPNGTGDLNDAYDRKADRHRGITTFLIKWKPVANANDVLTFEKV